MESLARLVLLLVFSAWFVAAVKGQGQQWLRVKFLGRP